jgi:hypothetical protein
MNRFHNADSDIAPEHICDRFNNADSDIAPPHALSSQILTRHLTRTRWPANQLGEVPTTRPTRA